jgi:hemoglobin
MSLYNDIGGSAAVNAAVDLFYEKVLADDRVKHFFADVDMAGQRGKQRKFLAYAFGAPMMYDGKDMRSAHADMKLTEEHFNAIAEHLRATMEDLNVPGELIDQAMKIVAGTHDDVLNL